MNTEALHLVHAGHVSGELAVIVRFTEDEVWYRAPGRGHSFYGRAIKDTDEETLWQAMDPDTGKDREEWRIRFQPLTLEQYNALPDGMKPTDQQFRPTEELWEYYRRRYQDAGMAEY